MLTFKDTDHLVLYRGIRVCGQDAGNPESHAHVGQCVKNGTRSADDCGFSGLRDATDESDVKGL
jgi:hypothetical protein